MAGTASAWAVFSPVEPPTGLHVAAAATAAAGGRDDERSLAEREQHVCHFSFPLPPLLVVYGVAATAAALAGTVRVYATVRREAAPRLVGQCPAAQGAVALSPRWLEEDVAFAQAHVDRMGKLTVEFERERASTMSTPPTGHGGVQQLGLPTPPHLDKHNLAITAAPTTPGSPLRSAAEIGAAQPLLLSSSPSAPAAPAAGAVRHQPARTSQGPVKRFTPTPTGSARKQARVTDATGGDDAHAPRTPPGRWGHSAVWCDDRLLVLLGQGERAELFDDTVWATPLVSSDAAPAWTPVTATGDGPGKRIGQASACLGGRLYVGGGSKQKRWLADLRVLDLASGTWSAVPVRRLGACGGRSRLLRSGGGQATGTAPVAAYHTMTPYGDELVVFGGVRDTVCLNELRIYNLGTAARASVGVRIAVRSLSWSKQSKGCGTSRRSRATSPRRALGANIRPSPRADPACAS
jgi:hypothetical protein